MADITAAMVRDLRSQTGAGMMDCKKALSAENGDMEAAIDWLRKKGLSAAAKKAGRRASEGLIGVLENGTVGAMVEVNAETDFVGRNDQFQGFVTKAAKLVSENNVDIDAFRKVAYSAERTVEEELTYLISLIGENMMLRRLSFLEVPKGIVASYLHGSVTSGLGRIGVLVALESEGDQSKLMELGRKIAMHVAATRPLSLTVEDLPQDLIEREKSILVEQARASGKPDAVIEKMVAGRLQKYYAESVLLEQIFVMDGETKIKDVVAKAAKEMGVEIKLTAFDRLELGDGVEKEEGDFAAEVASMTK